MKKKGTYYLSVERKKKGHLYANEGAFLTLLEVIWVTLITMILFYTLVGLNSELILRWSEGMAKYMVEYLLGASLILMLSIGFVGKCIQDLFVLYERMSRLFISNQEIITYRFFRSLQTGCLKREEIESTQLYIEKKGWFDRERIPCDEDSALEEL